MSYPASSSLIAQGFSSKVVMPESNGIRLPLIVGEAPGKTEDETCIPFHPEAEAGGLFKRLMQRVGVERSRFNITNVVWQRPPANELYDAKGYPMAYTHQAIDYWKPFLHAAIEELQPSVIIGLGRTALETLTGFSDIGTTRGYVNQARISLSAPQPCTDCNGSELDCFICGGTGQVSGWDRKDLHIPTICTYHPAFLNYGQQHLSGVFIRDVLAGLEIAEKGWQAPQLKVTPSPSPDAFKAFCEAFQPGFHKLTADIETPNSIGLDEDTMDEVMGRDKVQLEINRMSFCYASEVGGFSIPFEEPFLSLAKDLIARAKVLRGWNWRLFDWPRLLQHGFHTEAREEDLMDCWRHLHRTLPASVAYVAPFYLSIPPWKHEAHSQPEWYSAMDAIIEHEIGEGMEKEMRASGQWETYQRHVVEIISTNHGICTQMARNGLPIDGQKVEAFKIELTVKRDERLARLQELVPENLKPVKQKSGLKRVPKLLEGCVRRRFTVEWADLSKEEKAAHIAASGVPEASCHVEPRDEVVVLRYALLETFNPASHLQVKALIKHFSHKAKTDRKTKNESSGDDTLKSLITKYTESAKPADIAAVECYRLIRECRAIDKVLGTYVNGWKPDSNGLIHAIPGIWGDMFRISWRKPNLAATVADKKEVQIAAGFRKCICVGDQEVLIESDWKGMEALLVGYFAGDQDYMRLARLGVHDFMGHHMMKLPISLEMSDDELLDRFKWFKQKYPKQRDDAKHTIHGVGYGMTEFLMAELYEMTRTRARQLIELLFSLFPKVKLWQQATMQEAHEKCKLTNAWGYRMPFWNVFQWQQKRFDTMREQWVRHQTGQLLHCSKYIAERLVVVKRAVAADTPANDAIASQCWDLGDEAKSALAFLPRDTGAAMLKDTLLRLRDEHGLDKKVLRANAHDSILAITSRSRADEVAHILKTTMELPQEKLDGLIIGAEVSIGGSWDKASMKEWKMEAIAHA